MPESWWPDSYMKRWSVVLVATALLSAPALAQGPVALAITGAVEHPLELHLNDLEKMPHTSVDVKDHDGSSATYEGVTLAELLKAAGVPQGEKLRGAAMAGYVLAQAKDGYRVVFALPELDAGFTDAKVIVAFTRNGKPLPEGQGPLRIIVPQDKRPARWIRMLERIEVVRIP
jgi:DMSO/TMAO reductase YedYZ molybdopterin-dependent catalytic subunit